MQEYMIEGYLKTDRYLVNFNTEDLPSEFFDGNNRKWYSGCIYCLILPAEHKSTYYHKGKYRDK